MEVPTSEKKYITGCMVLCFRKQRRAILGQCVVERRSPTGRSGRRRRRGPEEQTVLVQPERRRQRRIRKHFVRYDPSEYNITYIYTNIYAYFSRCAPSSFLILYALQCAVKKKSYFAYNFATLP